MYIEKTKAEVNFFELGKRRLGNIIIILIKPIKIYTPLKEKHERAHQVQQVKKMNEYNFI